MWSKFITFSILSNFLSNTTSDNVPSLNFVQWHDLKQNDTIPPTIRNWGTIHDSIDTFSLLSASIRKSSESSWYVPSQHAKHSVGWNRTVQKGSLEQPYACTIQLYGLALEKSTLNGYVEGGTGYLQIQATLNGKKIYIGYEANETKKIHCYYMTSKSYGSEFIVRFLNSIVMI